MIFFLKFLSTIAFPYFQPTADDSLTFHFTKSGCSSIVNHRVRQNCTPTLALFVFHSTEERKCEANLLRDEGHTRLVRPQFTCWSIGLYPRTLKFEVNHWKDGVTRRTGKPLSSIAAEFENIGTLTCIRGISRDTQLLSYVSLIAYQPFTFGLFALPLVPYWVCRIFYSSHISLFVVHPLSTRSSFHQQSILLLSVLSF